MKQYAPLSKEQFGIYVESAAQKGEICYNLPYIYELDKSLDEKRLCMAIEKAFKAHPTLFTRIELNEEGEPVQFIDMENEDWTLDVEEIEDIEQEKSRLVVPYDIYGGRLFHVNVLRNKDHYYLFLDYHHLIVDGTSMQIMLHEIEKAYLDKSIEPEEMTLMEAVKVEAQQRETPAFEEAKSWYAQNFDCGETFTQLTPDLAESTHTEDSTVRTLSIEMTQVDKFCKCNGIFKSNFFTSAFAYLLAKYNNENESLFNTVYHGRSDKHLSRSIGMFVQTFPVYAKYDDTTTVLDYLKAGQDQMSGCREHSIYSYSDLQQDMQLQTNVAFAWHGNIFSDNTLMGKPMRAIRIGNSTSGVSLYIKAFILDDHYRIKAEYASNEYSKEIIEQFLESYEAILNGFITQEKLSDIESVTPEQIKTLDEFNLTESPYDDSQTIVSLFRKQAAISSDKIAVVYKDKSYTYRQVDDLSDHIAAYIAEKGLGIEDVVSILIPRCEWMAIAALGVLKAGCAYQPLDPTYPKERLDFMIKDANVKMLIVDADLFSIIDDFQGEVIFTRDLPTLSANGPIPEGPTPHSLYSMVYTSGSTGVPKGCQIEHCNMVAFCHMHQHAHKLNADSRVAAYASFGFDASLMEISSALTIGAQLHIIPEEIRLDLVTLNDFIEENGITHVFMTTQVAYQFATNFENKSLKHLLTGGEKLSSLVPPSTYLLSNGYGPSETICYVTNYDVTEQLKNIPIGKAQLNVKCYITDKNGHRLPIGAAGELWVAGPQVTRGYLNRPEKTAEVFIMNPFNSEEKYNRVYRSGDIVRYLPSGDIEFVGRKDGQVKIRGFRVELKEVESVIREFAGIKDVTVQAFEEEGGGKYIAAFIVSDQQIDVNSLNNFILEQKPPYMVPAVTMQIDSIPLNQNGKVNKRALPKPERVKEEVKGEAAPMNVLEEELHELIASIVGNTDFGVTTLLSFAGLTSISAIKLAVQVNKRYDVMLDSKALVKTGTLQTIENEILKKMLEGGTVAQKTKTVTEETMIKQTSVPLSYAQAGVYFECLKNPASTIYNIPYLLSYPEGTDAETLADAVKKVAESHPELGVHFITEGDAIVQTLIEGFHIEVPITSMSETRLAEYKNEFVQPFNLQTGPLCRLEVVKTENGVHLLMDTHHLVFDGGSADLFIRQLNLVLEGQTIEKESYTYMDFVVDQQKAESTDEFKASQQFFAGKLQTCEGASEIPADLPKTDEQGYIGEAVCPADHDKVKTFCRKNEITPAHLFLGATAYVISRYTNNREVYLCTVSNGRSNLRIADTVGMFVNTLALGIQIDDVTVSKFLQSTSQLFDETIHHEDYPFARIASDYGFRPAIAYAYQVGVLSEYTVNGKPIQQELLELNVPKFKINIKIEDRGVVVQYDDSMYSKQMAKSISESIVSVAEHMMAQPGGKVRKLSIISPHQEEELSRLRQTASDDAPFKFFHECIGHFAQTQPDQDALIAIDARFSYKEMDEVTNRIASGLRERGVKECDRVALLLPRTSRLILSLFGVLKSGAAYIPCDPEYPADRVNLILEDSEARYIITTKDRMGNLAPEKTIDVEELISSAYQPFTPQITPDDLAYLIYTSGSTGRPKGVMLRHEGICNYLYGHPANVFANGVLTDAHRILSVTTISFDAALQDIGMAYYNGKTLILATEEQANNPLDLAQLINEQQIDMVSGTPSRWQTWLTSNDFCDAISKVHICRAGGEKFSDQLLTQMRAVTKARIFNCYGPTEITVASNNKELTHAQMVTVGKPQLNVKEFIVDQDGNELPVGVVGELYIGGRGVARGYNNLDEMTRERFIEYNGERVYKSGDYAKWLSDGDVVILGRTDHQIKLRGLRIELGEIENVMLKVKGIEKVVILIRKLNGKEHLCAYYTADHEIAPENVKAEISKSLTQYMVPTAYLQLKEMPMTPNGKTDVKALPDPELAISSAYEEPVNDAERKFCSIFADILQMDKVGATDNFFELGGTSLVVTRVIIEADKVDMHIAYGDVFANPTPRQLARLFTGEDASDEGDEISNYDYTAINRILQRNNLSTFREGVRQLLGDVLLTGATGYLGIHILRELIDSDAGNIYCLVRGRSQQAAENRLRSLLFYYFSNAFKDLFGKRIHIILGDVTEDLSEKLKSVTSISTVFNCAAIVKHFSEGTEIEDVNIGGAKRCIEYCLKQGVKLVHVSTASTRGLWVGEVKSDVFTEQRFYMGQYLGNKYIYSKFMAERFILEAVATQGLNAKIMRVGNLAARSTDGEFQANFSTNSFMGRIKVYNMLGCCPYGLRNKRVEFSPINEVARAIVLLAMTPEGCTVFHPYNIHGQFLGDVLMELTSVGEGIRFVEKEEFDQAMAMAGEDPQKAKQMSSLLAYQDLAHGQTTTDVSRDNDYTTQVLYRLGFAWSPTSWDYVERMLKTIGGFGFFE